jgi:hypothetical protein
MICDVLVLFLDLPIRKLFAKSVKKPIMRTELLIISVLDDKENIHLYCQSFVDFL